MGASWSKHEFVVDGRTVLITGGSRGMGLHAARQLAEKGANVMIVARDTAVLEQAIHFVSVFDLPPAPELFTDLRQEGAKSPGSQRFHQLSADVTTADECLRIVRECIEWNNGQAPDVVWCAAGTTHPTLFVDTPHEVFRKVMDTNYFSCVYMAQAVMKSWLSQKVEGVQGTQEKPKASNPLSRHLIFTGSFLSFYSVAGYASYNPTKAAIRSLADTLSQEVNLYAGAHPEQPKIRVHGVYPASILTKSFEEENLIKSDMTKMLEEDDKPLMPDIVARRAIAGLEQGEELIGIGLLTRLVMTSVLGGSIRGGFLKGLFNTLLAWPMIVIMIIVRWDMDAKVRKWGRTHGPSGMKP